MSYGYPGQGYGPPHGQGGYQQGYPPSGPASGLPAAVSRAPGRAGLWIRRPSAPARILSPRTSPRGPASGLRRLRLSDQHRPRLRRRLPERRGPPPPPPQGHQEFGHGAPQGYHFQYSNCTGKRKALLIGINYFGQQGELRGCINDVHNVSNFLIERYNYKREDMVILTDDQQNPVMRPTRDNIIRAMQWLVAGAQRNDALFLHYSGHGGQTQDLDGDEEDGYDEVIYPVDFKQTSHIVDDEIHPLGGQALVGGVRLTAIFDSCHSGSVLDLPYLYSTKGVLKEPNLAKEAGQGLLSAITSYARGDLGGVASSVFGFAKTAFKGDDAYKKTIQTKTSPADVIMWSGSKDDQTS